MRRLIKRFLLDYLGIAAGIIAAALFFFFDADQIKMQTEPLMISAFSQLSYLFNPPISAPELYGIGIDSKTVTYLGELPIREEYLREVLTYLGENGTDVMGLNLQLFDIASTPTNDLVNFKASIPLKVVGEFRFVGEEEQVGQKYPLFPELTRAKAILPTGLEPKEIVHTQPYDPRVAFFKYVGFSARSGAGNRVTRVPLILKQKDNLYFSLPFLTYLAFINAKPENVQITKHSLEVIGDRGKVSIPIDNKGNLIIRYPETESLPKIFAFNYVLHLARTHQKTWERRYEVGMIMPYYSKKTLQIHAPDNKEIPIKLVNLIALNTLLTNSGIIDQKAWIPIIEAVILLVMMLLLSFGLVRLGLYAFVLSSLGFVVYAATRFIYGNEYFNILPIIVPNIASFLFITVLIPFRSRVTQRTAVGLPRVEEDGMWGEFKILQKLGQGAFGIVYHALDTTLKRDVVLKILLEQENETAMKRLITEGQAIARVQHPNVVNVYRVAEHDGYVFLVMEYVKGESLDKILEKKGRLPWHTVSNYFAQLLAGLGAAHAKNIIHRDIKPGNVIIAEDGTAKLTDFGLARLTDQQQRLTATQATVGTVMYMAPEQCQGGDLDSRTDLYALGATMYEALAGTPPHPGTNPAEVLLAKLTKDALPLSTEVPEVPESVDKLFHTLLEIPKEHRFKNTDEVQQYLKSNHLIASA